LPADRNTPTTITDEPRSSLLRHVLLRHRFASGEFLWHRRLGSVVQNALPNTSPQSSTYRRSWPFLRTPIAVYLIVMVPICGLQVILLLARVPAWMKISAGIVVAMTLVGFVRGYVRRLKLSEEGARLTSPLRTIEISWSDVKHIGVYIPGGGLGATEYLYITAADRPPTYKWEIDDHTIQIQNRPGLLEAVNAARQAASAR